MIASHGIVCSEGIALNVGYNIVIISLPFISHGFETEAMPQSKKKYFYISSYMCRYDPF